MKMKNIISTFTLAAMAICLTACDGEKDLVVIEGNLPIKASSLFMVGDATPNGWSIDQPTPLTASEEDPLVFVWEGSLNTGEMKLCLSPGSWNAPFIRPLENGTEIGKGPIDKAAFQMHAGDPDEKWRVAEAGSYRLKFDLRNWTMSTAYTGGVPETPKTPIETDVLYIVGSATPCGWNIDAPQPLEKTGDFTFVYEGSLKNNDGGEMKACIKTGDWGTEFIRPETDGVEINKDGAAAPGFIMTAGPDNKWRVTESANYRLTFNLKEYTVKAEFISDIEQGEEPEGMPQTDVLYMIGDATPGGWSLDDAQTFTQDPDNKRMFSWTGELVNGDFKACIEKSFDAPFLRPSSADVTVDKNGVSAGDFVFTTNPDDKWKVTEPGTYTITFDLDKMTIDVKAANKTDYDPKALKVNAIYLIGSSTPWGWSLDDAQGMTRDTENIYVFFWEGELKEGELKACETKDWGAPFLRPTKNGVEISSKGAGEVGFVFTAGDPDNKWNVTEAGKYRISFNLLEWTITATKL